MTQLHESELAEFLDYFPAKLENWLEVARTNFPTVKVELDYDTQIALISVVVALAEKVRRLEENGD